MLSLSETRPLSLKLALSDADWLMLPLVEALSDVLSLADSLFDVLMEALSERGSLRLVLSESLALAESLRDSLLLVELDSLSNALMEADSERYSEASDKLLDKDSAYDSLSLFASEADVNSLRLSP